MNTSNIAILARRTSAMVWLGLLLILACVVPPRAQTWGDQVIGAEDPAALKVPVVSGPEIWKNPSAPRDARVNDLMRRLSLAEKASWLQADAPAISRLDIPANSFRNECIHGVVARFGYATLFPQAIGVAAKWDPPLIRREAEAIATEARAHFND